MMTGIGGQGIQLMAKTLATAAMEAGLEVQLAAEYGGEMRGGPSQASVVLADRPIDALPILASYGAAIVHHHVHGTGTDRLRPGGTCVVNASIVDPATMPAGARIVSVEATKEADALGATQGAGLLLMAAYDAAVSGIGPAALIAAMEQLIPPYRAAAIAANRRAIERGAQLGALS